jgi:hypothetical protein
VSQKDSSSNYDNNTSYYIPSFMPKENTDTVEEDDPAVKEGVPIGDPTGEDEDIAREWSSVGCV